MSRDARDFDAVGDAPESTSATSNDDASSSPLSRAFASLARRARSFQWTPWHTNIIAIAIASTLTLTAIVLAFVFGGAFAGVGVVMAVIFVVVVADVARVLVATKGGFTDRFVDPFVAKRAHGDGAKTYGALNSREESNDAPPNAPNAP